MTVVHPALEKSSGKMAGRDFVLCVNPDCLRDGSALADAMKSDRIVLGELDATSGGTLARVYTKLKCPRMRTDLRTVQITRVMKARFAMTGR